jgi:hypothetical protein
MSFYILFANILLSVTFMTMFYYGRYVSEFENFSKSLQQNTQCIIGVTGAPLAWAMYQQSAPLTVIYFVMVVLLLKFIITKLLMAIILYYFKSSIDIYYTNMKRLNYSTLTCDQIIERSEKDPLFELLKRFRSMMNKRISDKEELVNLIVKKKAFKKPAFKLSLRNKKYPWSAVKTIQDNHNIKTEIIDENDKLLSHVSVDVKNDKDKIASKDLNTFNLDFSENFIIAMRNSYFDSQNISIKLKGYYENRYKIIFVKAIIYVIFVLSMVFIYILNIRTPWHATIFNAISSALKQNVTYYDSIVGTGKTYNFWTLSIFFYYRQY